MSSSAGKRKAVVEKKSESPAAASPKTVSPKVGSKKRTGTMAATVEEAKKFLGDDESSSEEEDTPKSKKGKTPEKKTASPKTAAKASPKAKKDDDKAKKMKRAGTMDVTVAEAKGFLDDDDEKKVKSRDIKDGHATRGKAHAKEVLTDLLDTSKAKPEDITDDDRQKAASRLRMVFRLIDRDRSGVVDREEIGAALRSLGMKFTQAKITKVFKAVAAERGVAEKKVESITADEFVKYMMVKLHGEKKAAAASSSSSTTTTTSSSPAPKKTSAPAPSPSAASSSSSSSSSSSAPALGRAGSIANFYTQFAGMHDEIASAHPATALDAHANPAGPEFDLGLEGAFNQFTILVGSFQPHLAKPLFDRNPGEHLRNKGFNIVFTNSLSEFITLLPKADIAWIVSFMNDRGSETAKFVQAVRTFHERGGGLFIWGDNSPLFVEANLVLRDLLGTHLEGDTPGGKELKVGESSLVPGQFGRHLITSGIVNLHEGITICYPTNTDRLYTLGTSSNNHPCVSYADYGQGLTSDNVGRIVVDCGYTKMYDEYWKTAGTRRYVVNACVWLLGLDHKMAHGRPLSTKEA
eukprot:TRINITY_DN5751_c0_g1_i2.p1 TRINITY_DN5751_c0_g1~~TRINITY_DN5751_c0_g1_i2.p1  ORF type:complete len:596 (+),score=205.17 TRINITY_DN5751_c0_g1_i2:57-1790(+)